MKRLLIGLLLVLCGCEQKSKEITFEPQKTDYLVSITLDLSLSYRDEMIKDGKAYKMLGRLMQKLFIERMGYSDKVILSQVSGNKRALLWEGSPLEFSRRFQSAEEFNQFLADRSSELGSNVYDGMSDTLEYVMRYPGVRDGTTKTAVFVLSDMEENMGGSEDRLQDNLRDYASCNGLVVLYWVDQDESAKWRNILTNSGVQHVVQDEFVENPEFPRF